MQIESHYIVLLLFYFECRLIMKVIILGAHSKRWSCNVHFSGDEQSCNNHVEISLPRIPQTTPEVQPRAYSSCFTDTVQVKVHSAQWSSKYLLCEWIFKNGELLQHNFRTHNIDKLFWNPSVIHLMRNFRFSFLVYKMATIILQFEYNLFHKMLHACFIPSAMVFGGDRYFKMYLRSKGTHLHKWVVFFWKWHSSHENLVFFSVYSHIAALPSAFTS